MTFFQNLSTRKALWASAARIAAVLFFYLIGTAAFTAPQTIEPGAVWPDDRGKHVQSHGGGIIKVGDTYYWFGEDRSQGLRSR